MVANRPVEPYYNPANLEKAGTRVKQKEFVQAIGFFAGSPRLLRISEVARRLGISSSALRAWEALGLVTPQRTASRYRMYTEADVRLLQRALSCVALADSIPPPLSTS